MIACKGCSVYSLNHCHCLGNGLSIPFNGSLHYSTTYVTSTPDGKLIVMLTLYLTFSILQIHMIYDT